MVRDSHLTCGGRWGPIQEAKIDGDMNPTGRDRRGPNRQRQMGTYSQQVETDGDTYSTGRNRRGHDPTDILHVTCTQQVKPGPHQAVTETGAQQQRQVGSRQRQPVSEAQVPRADTGRKDTQTLRKSDPGLRGRALARAGLPGGEDVTCKPLALGRTVQYLWQTHL